jgi:hypothetical protein
MYPSGDMAAQTIAYNMCSFFIRTDNDPKFRGIFE